MKFGMMGALGSLGGSRS